MKIFEIIDEEKNQSIGVILYYDKKKDFIIELNENLDEWTAPVLFSGLVKNGIYTIPKSLSILWVRERIIPSGRQNIGAILKNHKIAYYDEMKLLELSRGRCSQDSLFIKKIDMLPDYVIKRRNNLTDCMVCVDGKILCIFEDSSVKLVDLIKFMDKSVIKKIMNNEVLLQSCKVGTGGYSINFGDSIDIPSNEVFKMGEKLPITRNDFFLFAKNNLMDTSECCDYLECSRQNISYLIKSGQLDPVAENVKGNIFMKGDVLRNSW